MKKKRQKAIKELNKPVEIMMVIKLNENNNTTRDSKVPVGPTKP